MSSRGDIGNVLKVSAPKTEYGDIYNRAYFNHVAGALLMVCREIESDRRAELANRPPTSRVGRE